MTPDSFFKINPNIQPGAITGSDRDNKRIRPAQPDRVGKDFRKILSRRESNEDDEESLAKKSSLEDELVSDANDKKTLASKKEHPKGDILDPDFNQTATLAKESKVAPKLGKEKLVAPPEEPWAAPAIEDNSKDELLKTSLNLKKSADLDSVIHSPAELFGRLAQEKMGQLKKNQLAGEIKQSLPRVDDLEISGSAKKGFQLAPEKHIDQDLASVNLFVLAVGQGDIVYADKLKPPKNVSSEILRVAEEITNEINADSTKTTIILKNSGIFNGVEVTVTSFKTAHGEINIQFANLTQETKNILDINLDSLKQALDHKGYTVHMIATTTLRDEIPIAGQPEKKEQSNSNDNQGSSRQKKNEDENAEEEIA